LSLALVTAACGTTEGPSLRDRAPAALAIAIAAPAALPTASGEAELHLDLDPATFQQQLVEALQRVNAGSIVFAADETNIADADVVLRPTVEGNPSFRTDQVADDWWASGGLWLVTWVGGLVTEDYQYSTDLVTDCAVFSNAAGRTMDDAIARSRISCPPVETSFFERNDFLSWPTLQSLVLPPFWTTDSTETTNSALSKRYVTGVADKLTQWLKDDFENQAVAADVALRMVAPAANGGGVEGNQATVVFEIEGLTPVRSVALQAPGQDWQTCTIEPLDVLGNPKSRVTHDLRNLATGDNLIRVKIETDKVHTRTLRIRRTDR